MEKLDVKDRKILYQLDLDSRQSFRSIGRKVGLSKDSVLTRVKNLQEKGIIVDFHTFIDTFKLGYIIVRVYLSFQNISPEIEKEIIQYFIDYKNSFGVGTCKEIYDLVVIITVKNVIEFHDFWNKTLDKYQDYIEKQILTLPVKFYAHHKTYLILDHYNKKDRDNFISIGADKGSYSIDELDYQILNEICMNSRANYVDLACKLGCSSQTIDQRIKNLIKNGVIIGFGIHINPSKIGFEHYKVDIYLKDHKKRSQIHNFIKYCPDIEYITFSPGYADIEFEIYVENSNRLFEILEEMMLKNPDAIKKYNYISARKVYKEKFLPNMDKSDFIKK